MNGPTRSVASLAILIAFAALSSATQCLAQTDVSGADTAAMEPIETLVRNAESLAETTPSAANFLNLSLQYDHASRYMDSIGACKRALKLDPNYADAYNNIAAAYNGLNMWDEAIAAANEAIRLRPDYELAKNNLALSISRKKILADNLAAAQKSAESSPTPENYLTLSLALHRSGKFGESIETCRKAILLKPDYAEAYNNIAAGNEELGRWDEAIEAANQALKLKPDYQLARNNLLHAQAQKKMRDAFASAK